MRFLLPLSGVLALVAAHSRLEQEPITGPHKSLWYNTLPGDGGTQVLPDHCSCNEAYLQVPGRLGVFWHFNIWSYIVSPLLE